MKYLAVLGLATAVSVTLLAVTASASATTLYGSTTHNPETRLPTGTEISAEAKEVSIWISPEHNSRVICRRVNWNGKTQNESGAQVKVSLESLTWSECNCEIVTLTNGRLDITFTSESNATVTGVGISFTYRCFNADCVYGAGVGTHMGTLTGSSTTSETARWDMKAIFLPERGVCISPFELEGSFVITNPDRLDVTES